MEDVLIRGVREMKKSKVQHGFTLAELLVVISIIAIVAAILFPVFSKVREAARKTVCISNARQIGMAIVEYANDNDDTIMTQSDNDAGDTSNPSADPNPADFQGWYDWVQPYIGDTNAADIQECPSYSGQWPIPDAFGFSRSVKSTYALSDNVILGPAKGKLSFLPSPDSTLLIAESPTGLTWFADDGPGATAPDWLMFNGQDHSVQSDPGQADDFGDPAYHAMVTGIGADGHAVSMPMDNANGGSETLDANGVTHDQQGGWAGLYAVGPNGELSLTP